MADVSIRTLTEIIDVAIRDMEQRLEQRVDQQVEHYRQRRWLESSRVCCDDMRDLWKSWNDNAMFTPCFLGDSVQLQYRGKTMNYCPFCGAKAR